MIKGRVANISLVATIPGVDHDQVVASLIVNRVHPEFGDESPEGLRARAASLRAAASRCAA